jgi:hypothetical protein
MSLVDIWNWLINANLLVGILWFLVITGLLFVGVCFFVTVQLLSDFCHERWPQAMNRMRLFFAATFIILLIGVVLVLIGYIVFRWTYAISVLEILGSAALVSLFLALTLHTLKPQDDE